MVAFRRQLGTHHLAKTGRNALEARRRAARGLEAGCPPLGEGVESSVDRAAVGDAVVPQLENLHAPGARAGRLLKQDG